MSTTENSRKKGTIENSQLDHLDEVAKRVAKLGARAIGGISTGEGLYVCLAANRPDLLDGYTVAEALARIGEKWVAELIQRWQYRGNPKNF